MMKYWIVVASKDHIEIGIAGGFIQANHGKPGPLNKMSAGDGVICYSSKVTYGGKEPCKAFTAIGQVTEKEIYRQKISEDFVPYRRDVNYHKSKDAPIIPLVDELTFIKNKKSWGYPFRFGFFEIPEHDFELIRSAMTD